MTVTSYSLSSIIGIKEKYKSAGALSLAESPGLRGEIEEAERISI
jgi:hypothetical protein